MQVSAAPRAASVPASMVANAVSAYLASNPPAPGANASDAQIGAAVAAYLASHPPAAGSNATDAQVTAAVVAYLVAHPPAAGSNATDAQVATAVAAYVGAHPPAAGSNATDAQVAAAVAAYLAAHPVVPLVGTVVIAQTAVVAIAVGIREITVALAGATPGGRYLPFCDSHTLNGGAVTKGRPAGYVLLDATCRAAGQIAVALQAPALAVGAAYALTVPVFQLTA